MLLLPSLEQVASERIRGRPAFNVFELFIPKPCTEGTLQFHGDQSKLRPVVTSTVSMFSLKSGGNVQRLSGELIAKPTMCAPVSIFRFNNFIFVCEIRAAKLNNSFSCNINDVLSVGHVISTALVLCEAPGKVGAYIPTTIKSTNIIYRFALTYGTIF